jgi:hypothetical protein
MKESHHPSHQPLPPRSRGKKQDRSDYVPAAAIRELLAGSFAARQKRLEAEDMLTTDQAAQYAGTTRVTINAWIAKGRAIGLTQTKRGFKLPRWQFEPAVWQVIQPLSQALQTKDGWALLSFLETPHGGLDGTTPRQALERGQSERVLQLAQSEGN